MPDKELATLYQKLGNAVADILEHPDCTTAVFECLTDFTLNIDNGAGRRPLLRYPAHARTLLPHCLCILSATDAEADEAQQPALTFEQARDKVTAAVCELIEHPDVTPGVADWVGKFTGVLLRKMCETPEALEDEADDQEPAATQKPPDQAKAEDDKAVFRNFIAATADLLACEAAPAELREAIGDAITDVGNKLEAYNEGADEHAVRTLSRVFGLSEEDKSKVA